MSKGSKYSEFDITKDRPSDAEIAALVLGPTGALRAPAIRAGAMLLVGFNADAYAKHLERK